MKEKFEPFFRKYAGASWRGFCRAGFTGAAELCRQLDEAGTEIIKDRPKITAGITGGFFVKRYNMPGFLTQIRRRFKTPRPFIVMRGAQILDDLQIPAPAVMAAVVEKNGFFCRREYLITALLDKDVRLMNYFIRTIPADDAWEIVAEKFLPATAKLHDAGAIHGDLNMRNCFLTAEDEAGFIDLDGMEYFPGGVPEKLRIKELSRLLSGFLMLAPDLEHTAVRVADAVERYARSTGIFLDAGSIKKLTENFITRGYKKYE